MASHLADLRPRLRRSDDLTASMGGLARWSDRVRRLRWLGCSAFASPPAEKEWLLFPFYHWVLDDERRVFADQLRYLRRFGDIIGLDEAMEALRNPGGLGGRYFCITFDDGFKNWITNALPVLTELQVPATFFVPTQYIGLDLDRDWTDIGPFYQRSWSQYERFFEFLTWDECRQIATAGFTIGSHTHSHRRLSQLTLSEVEKEMSISKGILERELGKPCRHFSCPWGKAGRDFDAAKHPEIARKLGFETFLTTEIGLNRNGDSPYAVRRIGTDPDLGCLRLRYALFPSWFRSLQCRLTRDERAASCPLAVT